MIKELIFIANALDLKGAAKEADYLDFLIKKAVFSGDKRTDKDLRPSTIYHDELLADEHEAEEKRLIEDEKRYNDEYYYDDPYENKYRYPSGNVEECEYRLHRNEQKLILFLEDMYVDIDDKNWIDNVSHLLNDRRKLLDELREEKEKTLPISGKLHHSDEPKSQKPLYGWLDYPNISDLAKKYRR